MKGKEEIIAGIIGKGKCVLDIGYAQHPNIYLDGDITGVDIVSAPAPYPGVVVDLNTDKLPFETGSIDAVAMGCTLAHVHNPLKVLSEVNRVLKPDGLLVVTSPNPNYYWETAMNVFYHFFKNRVSKAKHVEHFFEFSRFNMRTILDRCGFNVRDEHGFLFALVKTKIRFNPSPGFAYEIIYTAAKVGEPRPYATFEDGDGIREVPTEI